MTNVIISAARGTANFTGFFMLLSFLLWVISCAGKEQPLYSFVAGGVVRPAVRCFGLDGVCRGRTGRPRAVISVRPAPRRGAPAPCRHARHSPLRGPTSRAA